MVSNSMQLRLPFSGAATAAPATRKHCTAATRASAAAAGVQQVSLVDLVALHSRKTKESNDDGLLLQRSSLNDKKQLLYELEEAKVVLDSFIRERGIVPSNSFKEQRESFAALGRYLVNQVHSCYEARYASGRELTTLEIRGAMVACLEDLHLEHLEDENKRVPLETGETLLRSSAAPLKSDGKARKTRAGKTKQQSFFNEPENSSTSITFCVEVLGIEPDDIPKIVGKRPQLLHCSVENVLEPNFRYLESLGIQKESWRKIMLAFPHILAYSIPKISSTVSFLVEEVGLPRDMVGKVLTRFPNLVGYSIDGNLRPSLMFLRESGVEKVSTMIRRCPQLLGLSLELNLKPTLAFFRERGFSEAQVSAMLEKFPQLLSFSNEKNLTPKWEFLTTTGRDLSEVVDFPQYFSYKLDARIKERHARVKSIELNMSLNRMLTCSEEAFDRLLQRHERIH